MTRRALVLMSIVFVMAAVATAAATYAPVVTMSVPLPDGQTKELAAPESGVPTVALKDGEEVGFRPTIQDDRPWSRVIVAVFKMPTATHATQLLGEVELKAGGPAVQSKTMPAFKIAVAKVTPPTTATTS